MKKLFKNKKYTIIFFVCISVCLLLAAGVTSYFVFFNDDAPEDAEQYQILELSETKIPDSKNFAIVDEDGNIILTNNDVTSVLVVYEKTKDRYLELRLTESGAQKLKDALEDSELSIMLNGQKLASPVLADDVEENSAIVLGEYEKVMKWFNAIK